MNETSITMDHLIVLPCHSIWEPANNNSVGLDRSEWTLVSFQLDGHDHLCFRDHILKSAEVLQNDKNSQLIISGGQTKKECGPVSESQSYYQLMKRLCPDSDLSRVTTEEFARDSFENMIFLICRFFELHGHYPSKITVVGFEFKRNRFLDHHGKQALKWSNIDYIGNEPTPDTDIEAYFEDLHRSENRFAVQLFEKDWFGCKDKLLQKKVGRNPFNRYHGYETSNPKLAKFLAAIADNNPGQSNEEILSLLPW